MVKDNGFTPSQCWEVLGSDPNVDVVHCGQLSKLFNEI